MLTDTVTIIAQLPLVDAAPITTTPLSHFCPTCGENFSAKWRLEDHDSIAHTPPAALPQARPITFGVGDRVTILAGGYAGYTGTVRACRPARGTVTLTTDSGLILVGYRTDLLAPEVTP